MRVSRCLVIALLLLAAAALLPGGVFAKEPGGPRLAVMRWSAGAKPFALQTVDPSGGSVRTLPAGRIPDGLAPSPFYSPSWSPTGNRLAYTVVAGEKHGALASDSPPRIAVISMDGSRPALVDGGGFGPVFAPDGQTIAFARKGRDMLPDERGGAEATNNSTTIWTADLATGQLRQLTPWRDGLENVPSSFSPDGSVLAFSQVREDGDHRALAMPVAGGPATVLARDATEPVFSPDGEKVAFLRGHEKNYENSEFKAAVFLTDLFVAHSDGSEVRRLTKTPSTSESFPSWNPSGSRLAYAEMNKRSLAGIFGFGDAIVQINADGSCRTEVLSSPRVAYFGPAWQPGPGRGAGPIVC